MMLVRHIVAYISVYYFWGFVLLATPIPSRYSMRKQQPLCFISTPCACPRVFAVLTLAGVLTYRYCLLMVGSKDSTDSLLCQTA